MNQTQILALPHSPDRHLFTRLGGEMVEGKPLPTGFGVKCMKGSTVKSFVLAYRWQGKEKQFTIGRVGDWTITKAAARARDLRMQIDKGIDPLAERQALHATPLAAPKTLGDAIEIYLHDIRAKKSAYEFRLLVNTKVPPELKARPILELGRGEVALWHRNLKPGDNYAPVKDRRKPRTKEGETGDTAADKALTMLRAAVENYKK